MDMGFQDGLKMRWILKARLLLFMALCIVSPANSAPWLRTMDQAKEASQKERLPILVEVYAPWCEFCRKMRNEIYEAPAFAARSRGYILLSVNGEKDTEFSRRYRIEGFPTVLFLDHNGVEIARLEGYTDAHRFYRVLDSAYRKRFLQDELMEAVQKNPDGFASNYELGAYFARASMNEQARTYFWRAYRSPDSVNSVQRERVLYNIAVLSMRLEEYAMSASIFDAFVRNAESETTDVIYARYWRAVSLLKSDRSRREKQDQIIEDLEIAARRLPFPEDRNEARRLLNRLR